MKDLRRLAECLLDPGSSPEALERSCLELHRLLLDASGFDPAQAGASAPVALPGGAALAPDLAAHCLLDTNRTVAFMRGLFEAVREAQRRFPGVRLEVAYAGTGPLAPLAMPLMALLDSQEVDVTLIDVHERSVESVRRLIPALGLGSFVGRIVQADAAAYRHRGPIHVAVTETLLRALEQEPFVAIARNLGPQLAGGGMLVPERVRIDVALIESDREQRRWQDAAVLPAHHRLATILEVTAAGPAPGGETPVVVTVPDDLSRTDDWLALLTSIRVFGRNELRDHQSGLTVPDILWPLCPARRGQRVAFHYSAGPQPRVHWRRLDEAPPS